MTHGPARSDTDPGRDLDAASGRDPFADDVLARLVRSNAEYQHSHGHYIVPLAERLLAARAELVFLRPRAVWINKHTRERTVILDFASRVERVPDAAGGFKDDHQLVVHHTANVPPGFERGWGDDAVTFAEHWEPQTVTKPADSPITEERSRDTGMSGAAT